MFLYIPEGGGRDVSFYSIYGRLCFSSSVSLHVSSSSVFGEAVGNTSRRLSSVC